MGLIFLFFREDTSMYQALYRKWRPKTFADVVGQEHITQTLRRQAAQGRLSHAYLFTGTRGTGKTTCAKILAKAVNCQNPSDGDPCGQCPACLGIDNGSLLDVMELDAASNNGVDHVRALRDEAIYSPASVKYRVYIIDEVHMLSVAAFNALLKILEEPPAHLIFILATTELHKVPATILSRCQRFAFKRIMPQDIAQRLLYVSAQENIALSPDAAETLARLADGALRDALSLLDQCAAAGGTIDGSRVLDVLGLAGAVQTAQMMDLLLRRDVPGALMLLHQLYTGGKDVAALLGELSTLARDLLIRMTAPAGGAALLSGTCDSGTLESLAQSANATRLIYMATQLQSALAALPLSPNRRTDAELCLMRLCDESLCGDVTALAARLTRLEEGTPREAAPRPAPVCREPASIPPMQEVPPPVRQAAPPPPEPAPIPPSDPPPWDDTPGPEDGPPPYGEPVRREAPPPVEREKKPAPPPAQQGTGGQLWRNVAEICKNQLTPMYWYMLDDAKGTLEGDVLVVHCGDELTMETLKSPDAAAAIRAAAGEQLGRNVAVRFTLGGGEPPAQEDKLEELIRQGSRYDSFTVKD